MMKIFNIVLKDFLDRQPWNFDEKHEKLHKILKYQSRFYKR